MVQKKETANPLKITVNNDKRSPITTVDIGSDTLKYAMAKQLLITRLKQSNTINLFPSISKRKAYENEHTV
jgi:hypothetical protein